MARLNNGLTPGENARLVASVVDEHDLEELEALHKDLLNRVVRKARYETYWHREEKGGWAQHAGLPRTEKDWLTLQAWIVRKVFLPNARGLATPAFSCQVQQIFASLYRLYVFTSVASPKWQLELKKATQLAPGTVPGLDFAAREAGPSSHRHASSC